MVNMFNVTLNMQDFVVKWNKRQWLLDKDKQFMAWRVYIAMWPAVGRYVSKCANCIK